MSARVHILGGGPAGLMAAEAARAFGAEVDLYDRMGSVGRKFLIAGKGGLNLTHSDPFDTFVSRYGDRAREVERWLARFDAEALREWARGLGVETFVGSSGRVFPSDLKAAPLLRGWLRRLRASGVRFHVNHRWLGWDDTGALRFAHEEGERRVRADAVVLALGGGSWPVLGSDGSWTGALAERGIELAPLRPANCGFDVAWSAHFASRHAGAPIKPVRLEWRDDDGTVVRRQGEFVVSANGVEGSLIYALGAGLREAIARHGSTAIRLDLVPGRDAARLARDLAAPRAGRSFSEHLRRRAGIDGVKAGLLYEALPKQDWQNPERVAATLKSLPLTLLRPRPLDEAISTAGGVRFDALDDALMLRARPGVFVAGEMIDWEAPTGGYLLTACFASGRIAGEGAARWLAGRDRSSLCAAPDEPLP
ncbi:TIGR03862 family flavoprotein [Dokdonella sp.]|uniref:TIGR03862 family flavoprotein n=1 Tax=Dokdonella sp. TaxID=2291710 RepID=UPI001B221DFD|nr:TIGR03862 family flavoprotein [Dokdonella sp.]MBO9663494.1 TIGR03862 family flavoprotein [Dokdonella sp.]